MQEEKSVYSLVDFGAGQSYAQYVESLPAGADIMELCRASAEVAHIDVDPFRKIVQGGGGMRAIVVTEEWCHDTFRVLPLLDLIANEIAGFELVVFRGSEHPVLNDRLESEGLDRLPKLLFFSAAGEGRGRFMERSKGVQARMDELSAEFGDPEPLFQTGDESDKEKAMEIVQRIQPLLMKSMEERLWDETVQEWVSLITDATL